jgi:DNA primase
MCYLQKCPTIGAPQALERCQHGLNPKLFYDLHPGEAMDEIIYIEKMSLLTLNGGLWDDYTSIYWISEYLQRQIHIWTNNIY